MIDMIILYDDVYAVGGKISDFNDGSYQVKSIDFVPELDGENQFGENGYQIKATNKEGNTRFLFIPSRQVKKVKSV